MESTSKDNVSVVNLTARVIAEEARITSENKIDSAVAFGTAEKKCYKCNKPGQMAKSCKSKQTNNARCFRCKRSGHSKKL